MTVDAKAEAGKDLLVSRESVERLRDALDRVDPEPHHDGHGQTTPGGAGEASGSGNSQKARAIGGGDRTLAPRPDGGAPGPAPGGTTVVSDPSLLVSGMFHMSKGQCGGTTGSGTQGTRHKYPQPVTAQDVARQCELDHKCTAFQLDAGSKGESVSSAWIYHGSNVRGDEQSDALCYVRGSAPNGYVSMGGRCQVNGKADGKRMAGVSVAKAAQICNADPKCVGFDTDEKDPQKHVFFVTDASAQQLANAMKSAPPSKETRSCMIRVDPHIPEGFKRQNGRCAVKTAHGPSKCEPNIFEAASSGTTSDAKSFADAVAKCRARDDCTAIEVNKAHDTFTEYTIHTKDDVQGDTCDNAFCFVRDHSHHTKSSDAGGTPNPHKRCDSQPFVPDKTSAPYKALKTTDANTCQRACLSEGKNCNAWKLDGANKEGAPCELYTSWNGVQRVVAPDAGSLCFMGQDSDIKGYKDAATAFTVWDKSVLLETGDHGVATYAASEHACADRCSVTRGCKAIGYQKGSTPNAKNCEANDADCGICYLFNAPFESGHMLFRHTNTSDSSSDMFTANRA